MSSLTESPAWAEAASRLGRQQLADASDQVHTDTADLVRVAAEKAKVHVNFSKGTAAEGLHTIDYNRAAARAGSSARAVWTHAAGDRFGPADLLVRSGPGPPAVGVQIKTDQDPGRALRVLKNEKYDGMQRIVTSDQLDDVRQMAERRPMELGQQDVLDNLSDRVEHAGVSSSPVSRTEAEAAATAPRMTAAKLRANEYAREVGGATAKGAISGAAIGGLSAAAANALSVHRGEKTAGAALKDTGKQTADTAARQGVTAGLGSVIAIGLRRAGTKTCHKGGGPVAAAGCVVEASLLLHQYLDGQITREQLNAGIASATAGAAAGLYGGAIGQAVIPIPVVGALVGSLIATKIAEVLAADLATSKSQTCAARIERQELEQLLREAQNTAAGHRAQLDQIAAAHAVESAWVGTLVEELANAGHRGDYEQALVAVRDLQATYRVVSTTRRELELALQSRTASLII